MGYFSPSSIFFDFSSVRFFSPRFLPSKPQSLDDEPEEMQAHETSTHQTQVQALSDLF
jgi:hypothetical protein